MEPQPDPPTPPDAPAPERPPKRPWTILGRLTKAVREQNWFAVALELVIVVVGVVIGFQVTAWGQTQQERRLEIESLRELQTALRNDLPDIRANLSSHERATSSAALLREHLRARRPYADTLDAHFANVLIFTFSVRDEAAYETLKLRGMETVTNDSLRAAIGHVYGVEYPNAVWSQMWVSDFFREQQVPLYLSFFRDIRFFENATPTEYEALMASPEFAAMLDFLIPNHAITAARLRDLEADVTAVIAHLEEELADR